MHPRSDYLTTFTVVSEMTITFIFENKSCSKIMKCHFSKMTLPDSKWLPSWTVLTNHIRLYAGTSSLSRTVLNNHAGLYAGTSSFSWADTLFLSFCLCWCTCLRSQCVSCMENVLCINGHACVVVSLKLTQLFIQTTVINEWVTRCIGVALSWIVT